VLRHQRRRTIAVNQPCFVSTRQKLKKHTFEAVNVRITMIMLAAMTANKPTMFIARITLRMMKPGPAKRLLVSGILGERLLLRNETRIVH
jgi:hypothetical protein